MQKGNSAIGCRIMEVTADHGEDQECLPQKSDHEDGIHAPSNM